MINDVSEREYQIERQGQWVKGKSCDSFGPTGPWLVTPDEAGDPQNLKLWLEVDGKRYQDGSTNTMVYSVAFLIHYLSQFFTLQPGDVISTGTPPCVGMGQNPAGGPGGQPPPYGGGGWGGPPGQPPGRTKARNAGSSVSAASIQASISSTLCVGIGGSLGFFPLS